MKKRDRRELERYIRGIADAMGLRDWTLALAVETVGRSNAPNRTEGEWGATSQSTPGRKHALITLPKDARALDREELRQTVVHELVHCHFACLWDTLRLDLGHILTEKVYWVWIAGVERAMEYGVDAVADAIAPRMPLIDWPG